MLYQPFAYPCESTHRWQNNRLNLSGPRSIFFPLYLTLNPYNDFFNITLTLIKLNLHKFYSYNILNY